jgi:cell division septation protein DedD
MPRPPDRERGPSATGLIVASVSSAAAAVLVHALWRGGTILGAAVTPVLIELFAEALRRPVERMSTRTSPPLPGETVRIYRSRPRWLLAVVTGLAAFVLGAAGLTISEALLHRSIGDGRSGTTLFDSRPRPQPMSPPRASMPTPTPTPLPTRTPTPAPTRTPKPAGTPTPTPTPSPTPSAIPIPTPTPSATPTAIPTPSSRR